MIAIFARYECELIRVRLQIGFDHAKLSEYWYLSTVTLGALRFKCRHSPASNRAGAFARTLLAPLLHELVEVRQWHGGSGG